MSALKTRWSAGDNIADVADRLPRRQLNASTVGSNVFPLPEAPSILIFNARPPVNFVAHVS